MNKLIFILCLNLILLASCDNPHDNPFLDSTCDQITNIDNSKYQNNQSEGFSIQNIKVNGDCLEVEIRSGGCNGNSWKIELIDANRVTETAIEQRDLKILLDNEELCNALVYKTYSFDLRPLRTESNKVLLNLELWEKQILYEY